MPRHYPTIQEPLGLAHEGGDKGLGGVLSFTNMVYNEGTSHGLTNRQIRWICGNILAEETQYESLQNL